ncbi:hypothetical protein N473_04735 [Pseudoalteromonas luteoviolacea CPMOR-1]|uniref:Uncharacterized protein n=1 Tax=Pseudoalteromonas luteoviolacea CPMOR-1 TaxID=1365248 RepID=A0A167I0B6_9GAMM|nr:hypothetical protein [Pseudoalteromonas luteoviolacea]KZN58744.1 hypothetical protein N473_04735 [Pseudoalteromonas luteoviolacea CPMOR-1]
MTYSKTHYLFILLTLVLLLANIAAQLELTKLSGQISNLEQQLTLQSQKDNDPTADVSTELQDIQNRLHLLEQSAQNTAHQTYAKKQTINPNNKPSTLSAQQRVDQEFLAGRTQWQEQYLPTLQADSDKKAQMMVAHLSQNDALTYNQQQQVFSILRDNFIEVAYVIADTDTYAGFDAFNAQVKKLNQVKTEQLSQVLSAKQLSQLHQVDWNARFKQHALH